MPLGTEVGLGQGDIVLNGGPPEKGTAAPHFSAHLYYGQMAGWLKMSFGTQVGLGPGDIVLDGDPAPSRKGAQQHPLFGRCLLWPNGCPFQQLTSCLPNNGHGGGEFFRAIERRNAHIPAKFHVSEI